jgi:CBS domain-containing protein
MRTVSDIIKKKGNHVWSVTPSTTVFDTLKLMAEREIGAVVVLDRGNLVGIFSERDYARQVILKGRTSKDTPVREVMSPRVIFVRSENTVEDCMALMTGKRVRHLPVLQDGALLGMVSIGDVVKDMIAEKEFIIEQLANYIQRG